jgi:hypothetical protein
MKEERRWRQGGLAQLAEDETPQRDEGMLCHGSMSRCGMMVNQQQQRVGRLPSPGLASKQGRCPPLIVHFRL